MGNDSMQGLLQDFHELAYPDACWLVGCGLTSHSEIFQLYSDGAVVQLSNFYLLLDQEKGLIFILPVVYWSFGYNF